MKKKILTTLIAFVCSWLSIQSQTVETFESYTTGCATSFSSGGTTFNGTRLRLFIPGQCLGINVNGLGVGNSCSGDGCGTTSNKFFDNGGNYLTGQTYTIATTGSSFVLKSMYVFISTDSGTNPTSGSVTFVGKKAGNIVFSFTKTSWPNSSNGFSFVNFATEGGVNNSSTAIDAIEMTTGGSINYIAVDNFAFGPNVYFAVNSGTNSGSLGRASVVTIPNNTPTTLVNNSSINSMGNERDVFLDHVNGYIYWCEGNSTNSNWGVYRAPISPTPATSATALITGFTGAAASPWGVTVDISTNTLYMMYSASGQNDKIKKYTLSSLTGAITAQNCLTDGTDVVTGIDVGRYIAVDYSVTPNMIYWADQGATNGRKLMRAPVNTTTAATSATVVNQAVLSYTVDDQPHAIAIDPDNQRVYWVDANINSGSGTGTATTAKICYVPTNASSYPAPVTVLYNAGTVYGWGLALDRTNQEIYYGENAGVSAGQNEIRKFSISNPSGTVTNVVTGLDAVKSIKLDVGTFIQPDPVTTSITTTGTLSAFSTCSGTASAQQSFTVSGSNLTTNIVVTPSTGFEVSTTSGSGFASSVTLTQSGGTVGSTTIYVRLTNTATGTPSGNITCASTGATTQNVAASGTVNNLPTITLGSNPSICNGTTSANLTYSATTSSPNQYNLSWSAGAIIAGFTNVSSTSLPASPITLTAPSNPGAGTYTGTLRVTNSTTGCSSTGTVMNVGVNALPTITLGSNPSICNGSTSANLTYSATTSSPNQYNLSWSAGAIIAGFTNVSTTTLPASPITLTAPSNPGAGTYTGTLRVTNSTTGCTSNGSTMSVTVNALPTITLGSVTNVNTSATSFSLPYSATTGSPNQYSITTGSPTAMPSFSVVSNASLLASPISVTIPASATNTYNFVGTVTNSTTGCTSAGNNFSVTVVSAGTTINSIVRGTPSASTTNLNSVTYNITFGASVTGLSASNFSLTTSGVSGASIGTLSGSGANYTLTVNTGTGSGDITLNLANSTGLNPTISTSLPFVGETYTIDKTGPTVVTQNRIVYLNAAGTGSITAAQVDNGSSDASGIGTRSVSPSSFTCADVGSPITVTLTVNDNLSNPNTGTATITVLDTVRPVVITQNRTVYLNGLGTGTVSPGQVNNGSTDACGVASLSLSQTTFTRSNLGANTVTLTVGDVSNNTKTGTATVTVIDPFDVTTLTLSNGTLSPSFITTTTSYTSSVLNTVSSITLTPTLTLGTTTIQVRVNGGSYTSVTNGSASGSLPLNVGANTIELLLTNGLVTPNTTRTHTITITRAAAIPTVTVSGTLNAFNSCAGIASSQQSFTVSGSDLTNNIVITPPTGFEVSTTSGSGFTSSVTLTQSGGSVASTTIYTRITSAASGTPSGNITCVSTGATTQNVVVNGTVNTNPIATTSQTNVSCFGGSNGSLTVSVTGGTSPYSYNRGIGNQFSNSFTGLLATTYTITVTDANGCTATTPSATITQPASAVSGSTSTTNVSCNGGSNGSVNLTATGGTGTKTYLWSNAATTEDLAGVIAGTYTVTITDANGCTGTTSGTVTQASPISASTSFTNVSCNGGSNGSASVTASGGVGTLGYAWSTGATTTGITGRVAGTYTVTITDANTCTTTRSVTITQPTALSPSATSTNVSCNGGSNGTATASATGGVPGYTYEWSTGQTTATITGRTAGTYTVTITDANGCTATTSTTITQPVAMTASVSSQTNVSCFGGSNGALTIGVTGGTSPYSYNRGTGAQPSNSFTGLLATTYTVTVTDANGCTATTPSATITQPTSAVSGSTSTTNVSCNGGSNGAVNLTATGGTGTKTYLWSNAATTEDLAGVIAGTYTVTITDANGCTANTSGTVTQPSPISASTSFTNVSCNGGSNGSASVTASGGVGTLGYAWSTGATTTGITGRVAGTYTVTITDANTCTTTRSVTITQPTAISPLATSTNVSCNGGSNGTATASATGGVPGYTYEWSTGQTTATITGRTAGTYTVTITDANGCTATTSTTITQPIAMTASVSSQTNVSCFGGSNGALTIGVTGGTSPYSYNRGTGAQPSNSFTGLVANTFTVTVTDANGCTATTPSATITQPALAVSGSTSTTSVSCNGGSNGAVNLTATGGTGTKTYLWSNAATTEDLAGVIAGTYTVTITDANGCTGTTSGTVTQPSPISASTSFTNVSCNGGSNGSASVTASGGTGTLAYAWSNAATTASISGVTAGTYSVTITDANTCSISRTVTMTQPQTLIASQGTVTNVSCFGGSNGSLTVNVTGGTTPYSYDWTGTPTGEGTATASGLVIGNYSVNILDANGCSTSQNFSVFQPASLALNNSTQTNVSCNGGSNGTATLGVSGGTAPYSYDWSGTPTGEGTASISGLSAGTYSVLVTDNRSCTASSSFTITEPAVLVTTVGNVLNVSCNAGSDGRINTSTTGGTAPYSYNWTPGNPQGDGSASIINLPAGTYTLTVQDSKGCISTLNQTITEPTVLVSGFDTQTNVLCNGASTGTASVTPASGGTAPYSYNWTPGNPQGDGTAAATNLSAGTYNCKITDNKGCFVDVPFTITENAAITSTQSFSVCFGESVTVGTSVYNQSGTYTNVFEAQNGCDSTVTTTLIVRPLISSSQSFTICNGESVTVGTSTYNATGTYTDIFTAIDGCDSVVTTSVFVNPTFTINQTIQLCFGETLTVGTTTYTASGTYTNVLQTVNGCDSTVNTNLTVIPFLASTQNVVVCFGETYSIGDSVYAQSGTYTNLFSGVSGCDSTVTTNLIVRNENIVNQTISICAGETYSVGNNVYSQTGTYTNFFTTAEGCDSTHTLNLIVKSPVIVTTTLTDATIKANLGGATYQWINCSNNQAIAGATNQTFTASVDGDYAVIITYNGCTDTSECVTVENVSLTENPSFTYKLYPNPATSNLTIEASSTIETIELLDLSGKVILSETTNTNIHNFNVETLSRGMYLVRFTTNGEMVIRQFVKE